MQRFPFAKSHMPQYLDISVTRSANQAVWIVKIAQDEPLNVAIWSNGGCKAGDGVVILYLL